MKENKKREKQEKFKKSATIRTNAVLKALNTLGYCANKSTYDYSKEDVKKIFSEIEHRTKEAKSKFHQTQKNEEFSL